MSAEVDPARIEAPADDEAEVPEHRFDDDDSEGDEPDKSAEEPVTAEVAAKGDNTGGDNGADNENEEVENKSEGERKQAPDVKNEGVSSADDQKHKHEGVVKLESSEGSSRYKRIIRDVASAHEEATSWLNRVLIDGPRAVADILAVVVSPAMMTEQPAEHLMTPAVVMDNDPARAVQNLCDAICASEPHPQHMSSDLIVSRRARHSYEEFWQRIAKDSSDAVLYDTDCFDTILSWLEIMSTAKLSMLRYAACLAAYSIVDGFIALGTKIRFQLSSFQRQLATEKRRCAKGAGKKSSKKAGAQNETLSKRGKELSKKVDDLSANNGELIELSDKVFTGIFVLKYRDVAPEIRVASVAFLGKWILHFPDHYLDDTHNKYIGWLLSDKDSAVRRACIVALIDMLHNPEFYERLEHFLSRFKHRIIEMTRDRDSDVSSKAIRLCSLLVPYEILDQKSCEVICDQAMEETHPAIRRSAGHFIASLIKESVGEEVDVSEKGRSKIKSGKRSSGKHVKHLHGTDGNFSIPEVPKAQNVIRELVLLVTRDDASRTNSDLIHDAVWDSIPSLRCWSAFANLLLEGHETRSLSKSRQRKRHSHSNEDEGSELNEEEKAVVCELLLASAREVSGHGDKVRFKLLEKLGKAGKSDGVDSLSRVFAPLIAKLLVQFQANSRALAALVQLPRYFSITYFEAAGEKKHFVNLLNRLVEVISRQTASLEVMQCTVETFRAMKSEKHPLNEVTSTALLKAATSASKDLRQLVAAGVSHSNPTTVGATVLKILVTSELLELPESTFEDILSVIRSIAEEELPKEFNDTIVVDSVHSAVRVWVWSTLKVRAASAQKSSSSSSIGMLREGIMKLVEERNQLLSALVMVSSHPFNSHVRASVTRVMLTILTLSNGISRSLPSEVMSGDDSLDGAAVDRSSFSNKTEIVQTCVDAIKAFVLDLVKIELGYRSDLRSIPKNYQQSKGKIAGISNEDLGDFCTSLVQACLADAVSEEAAHLPFLCLLVNRRSPNKKADTVYGLYRSRLSDRRNIAPFIVRAFFDLVSLEDAVSLEDSIQSVALLAHDLAVSVPQRSEQGTSFHVLKMLMDTLKQAIDANNQRLNQTLAILSSSAPYLASMLNVEMGSELLVIAMECNDHGAEKLENGTELFQSFGDAMKPFVAQLESISSGTLVTLPSVSKPKKQGRSKSGQTVRSRKKSPKEVDWPATPPKGGLVAVRRSARPRKPKFLSPVDLSEEEDSDDFEDDPSNREENEQADDEFANDAMEAESPVLVVDGVDAMEMEDDGPAESKESIVSGSDDNAEDSGQRPPSSAGKSRKKLGTRGSSVKHVSAIQPRRGKETHKKRATKSPKRRSRARTQDEDNSDLFNDNALRSNEAIQEEGPPEGLPEENVKSDIENSPAAEKSAVTLCSPDSKGGDNSANATPRRSSRQIARSRKTRAVPTAPSLRKLSDQDPLTNSSDVSGQNESLNSQAKRKLGNTANIVKQGKVTPIVQRKRQRRW